MTGDLTAWFVVPEGIDDPERVSGGNVYDRHIRDGLRRRGWEIRMSEAADAAGVATALAAVERGGLALVDGLVAGWAPEQVEAASRRSRVVVLAHMVAAAFPDASPELVDAERRALRHADRVIATSDWAAAELRRRELVPGDRIRVVPPGSRDSLADVDPDDEGDLLCVGVVAPHKGQDLLLDALDRLREHDWTCTMAGSHSVAPEFSARAVSAAERLGGRVRMPGVLDEAAVDILYRRAGVLVAPSRAESFGMAIADARRAGLPVIATSVGGIPDTVAGGGAILVPDDDPVALAEALRGWMTDPQLRSRLRAEAARARPRAPRWHDTIDRIDDILRAG
ncbi:MAG TPA: glycosyltransferase family 4 protein [Pseudolysinimonas sp.]